MFWTTFGEVHASETVYGLNGRYYRTSLAQEAAHLATISEGLEALALPVTTPNPRTGPTDPHLNQHAVDQVMRDLGARLLAADATESGR